MSKKTKAKGKGTVIKVILLIVALLIVLFLGLIIYANSLGGNARDSGSKTMITVAIEKGSTTSDIGALLEKKKIINSGSAFKLYTAYKRLDGTYQAGTYALSPSMTASEISHILQNGKTNDITFTIPEGYTEYDIASRLASIGLVDKDQFVSLLENGGFSTEYTFLKKAQKGKHNLEGYLFPSTYTIPATSDGDFIISTMLSAYQKVFTDADRAKAKKLGYSENEIIIIASIIEKEAAVDEDRAKVASVIYNRLDDGMALQMDSTVQYVLSLSSDRKKDLSIDDTKVDSKYNTYKYTGLPPGPICNPGRASIEAALNPAKTKYMYFILSDRLDDTMVFSTTYKQFLKDKEAYYKARDKAESKNN
ncbi:endolytic transglycosylase MltG [Hornefia butyriciproducens]|uniref:Endolytic murein transglycosylase n=1 Tax=Hornefia butyriciproducens TaxID=2652293 RepID=A0A6L5Y642_9FIRM|nr:endolytic transglycosylase MltG [Hornefia butyriciproducens]MST52129.1 endolytic transglycosylase MltG [Hornefia butyriciproducens]